MWNGKTACDVGIVMCEGAIECAYVGYELVLLEGESDFSDETIDLGVELYAEEGHVSYII